jgi:hypothetical protein
MKLSSSAVGTTSWRKFLFALVSGFFLLGILIGTFAFTGTFYAMSLGGMGDFHVSFQKLEGTGFTLSPHYGETGEADGVPMVRNTIESATIEGLHISKDLKMPTGKWIRINVVAHKPAQIAGLIQDARFIDADLEFGRLSVKQRNTSGSDARQSFMENWTQNAETITIRNAQIVTDYLFQNMVSLNEAEIYIESIEEPGQRTDGSAFTGGSAGGVTGGQLPDTGMNVWMPLGAGVALLSAVLMYFFRWRRSVSGENLE